MKLIVNKIRLQYNENQEPELILSTKGNIKAEVEELKNIVAKGKQLSVDIKQYRHKRSLDSNAYMWILLSEMANILKTTKDELYLQMLDRYGVFTHVVVKPQVVDRVKQEWRTVRELGEVTINGKQGIQLMCYFGSSTYDSKEMSVLLDGVVQEAKELGISTLTQSEIELMKTEWSNRGLVNANISKKYK